MEGFSNISHNVPHISLSWAAPPLSPLSPDRIQCTEPISGDRNQTASAQLFDALSAQEPVRHPPEVHPCVNTHNWHHPTNRELCPVQTLDLHGGESSNSDYPTLPYHPRAEALFFNELSNGGPVQHGAICGGNGPKGTLQCLAHRRWDNIGASRKDITNSGLPISNSSDRSKQALTSHGLPVFQQTPYRNISTFPHLTDHHPSHTSVVARQEVPNLFPNLSHHSLPSSQLFLQGPSRNSEDGNGSKYTGSMPITIQPENTYLDTCAPSIDSQLSPYGDHSRHARNAHRYTPYIQSTASCSTADDGAGTSLSRPRFASVRKKTPAVGYEADIGKLQTRCRLAGAEDTAVDMFPMMFANGVTLEALIRRRTSAEIEAAQFGGSGSGPVYLALLEEVMKADAGGDVTAYRCRLCPNGGNVFAWKKPRDALRHLKRDHFGIGDRCPKCGKTVYTNGEMKNHQCWLPVPKATNGL